MGGLQCYRKLIANLEIEFKCLLSESLVLLLKCIVLGTA